MSHLRTFGTIKILLRYCKSIISMVVLVHGRSDGIRLLDYHSYPGPTDLGQGCVVSSGELNKLGITRLWPGQIAVDALGS